MKKVDAWDGRIKNAWKFQLGLAFTVLTLHQRLIHIDGIQDGQSVMDWIHCYELSLVPRYVSVQHVYCGFWMHLIGLCVGKCMRIM